MLIIGIFFNQTAHHNWLLVNFLEHEEWVRAFRNFTVIDFNRKRLTFFDFAIKCFDVNGIGRQRHNFLILEFNKLVGFAQHSQRIGSHNVEALAPTDQKRALVLSHIQYGWIQSINHWKSVWALNQLQRLAQRLFGRQALTGKQGNQLNNNFGIRITMQFDVLKVLLLQVIGVGHNPVMHQIEAFVIRNLRMCIGFGRPTVCCPACMTNPHDALNIRCHCFFQIRNMANPLDQMVMTGLIVYINASWIIPPIFQLLEPFK